MSNFIMYFSAIVSICVVFYMLIKKMDIKITLFFIGIVLMFIALASNHQIAIKNFSSSGLLMLDPIKAISEKFRFIISNSGFIILILGGYAAYMNHIRANDATVYLLLKPIKTIKSAYLLIPAVFFIGHFLSIVIPSAANLAIILLATIYPIMRKAGLSALSAGGVIATTATIMPTPLGGDNIALVEQLQKVAHLSHLSVSEYVFNYHARVSIPTLILMAIIHLFWQKYCDKKANYNEVVEINEEEKNLDFSLFTKIIYAILPLFPIFLLVGIYIFSENKNIRVEIIVLFSFVLAIICELIRSKSIKKTLDDTKEFFKGMGNAMPIVALLVAGTTFVLGLQSIGIIAELQSSMTNLQANGFGFVLPLVLVALSAVIVLLSGSGVALFFAMIPLLVPLSEAANIDVLALCIPMELTGNLLRGVSPVSAVVMIVAGTINKEPLEVVKRTSVPMISGVIFMFCLSMFYYL